MAMRKILAGASRGFASAAARASETPFLAKSPTNGAPIRAYELPLLTNPPSRAGQVAILPRAPAMGPPLLAAETTVVTKAPAMGGPLGAGLGRKVGLSFAANAAASARFAASRVFTPLAAGRVWMGGFGAKTNFSARCLSSAAKPPPAGSVRRIYVLGASLLGVPTMFFFLPSDDDYCDDEDLPDFVDWSKALNFPPVADPLYNTDCGSCWAVTGVKSIEAYFAIDRGVLFLNLSIQQVIDCAAVNGCGGGSLVRVYNYAATTGLTTEEAYPRSPGKGRNYLKGLFNPYCNMQGQPIVAKVKGYQTIPPGEKSLMRALQRGPVAVDITTSLAFRECNSDTILELEGCPSSAKPNHSVLVVGYGTTTDGHKYWKVMNTWGPNWGKLGFCRFRRVGAGDGVCGITPNWGKLGFGRFRRVRAEDGVCGITKFEGYRPIIA